MPHLPVSRVTMSCVLIHVALSCPTPLRAQRTLTLPDAVAIAQERGHRARAAAAAREAARYQHRQFRSGLLPQLSLVGTVPQYNRSIIPVLQPDGSTLFRAQQQTSGSLSMRLSQRLPITGGDLFVSSSLQRLAISGVQESQTWSATPISIGLRQEILRPNVLAWDVREQTVQSELEERQYLEALEDIAIQTAGLFFDVYAASVGLGNAVGNVATNDTLYRLNQGRFEVGKIGENDLLQSELALLRARTSLDGARLEYDRAAAALRLALNLPPGTPFEVVVPAAIPTFEPDTARAVTEALARRASVTGVALQDVQARRRITEAKLAQGIGATIQASFGLNATGAEAGQAYQNLLDARQFTLSVEVPFWQWGAHGEGVHAAEAQRDQARSLGESTLEQTAFEAHYAALQLSQAARNVALSAKADTVADKRFTVAYNRYVIGRISIDNLYLAQNEKDQALAQFVQALRGYWQSYYQLRRLTLFDFERGEPIQ